MNLAPYIDVKFQDKEAFSQFVFIHMISHESIGNYVSDQNLALTNYPLDNTEDKRDWMFLHNRAHVQIAQRLGLTEPQDLELYDLEESTSFYDWMSLHGGEHDRILLAMGF